MDCRNLILIGFMGTGKTAVGKQVARMLGKKYVDTDEMVEERAKASISELFSRGEETFRQWESQVLHSLLNRGDQVVATGGGVILREENRRRLAEARQQGSLVVWLWADSEAIYGRIGRSTDRPLLIGSCCRERIDELLSARFSLYQAVADVQIDTSCKSVEHVCAEVCALAKGIWGEMADEDHSSN